MDGSVITKPSALNVSELVDKDFFRAGDEPLPADELVLKPDVLAQYHLLHCTDCRSAGRILEGCYGSTLLACATNGFNPVLLPDSDGNPMPLYSGSGADGNHASADRYPEFVQGQIAAMLERGAIEECFDSSMISSFNPLGVAMSHSSLVQAEILTGITIVDELSLKSAKEIAVARGLSLRAKPRLVVDQTGSGVNGMLVKKSFAYVSPQDVTDIVTRGCYFASCDGSKYYYHFMTAESFRRLTGFTYQGRYFRYTSLPFGTSPAPLLVSGMSAEFGAAIRAQGAKVVWILDDFLIASSTLPEAVAHQQMMEHTLTSIGISLEDDKRVDPTQCIVFMGKQYDSVAMSTSVSPPSAALFVAVLAVFIDILVSGGDLSVNIIRHLCGKLIDYASVCQQGKSKIHAAWRYLKFGPDLWPSVRAKMIEDLMWWETKLILWSTGSSDGCYPIVNTSTLLDNLDSVGILVSDYSGSDVCGGFGGLSGTLLSTNPRYFALQHSLPQERVSSFVGELRVLRHQLRQDLDEMSAVGLSGAKSTPSRLLLVWVTDNESAAFAVNSGRCTDDAGHVVLEEIFDLANTLRCVLLAVWIPRESNTITDRLSHYASWLGVSEIGGRFSELPDYVACGVGCVSQGSV